MPWACALSTCKADMDAAQYQGVRGAPRPARQPPTSSPATCRAGGACSPSAYAPAEQVVAAASETERTVTNGMSEYARRRGEHQRRPAGERDAGGLRRAAIPWRASPFSGRLEEAAFRAGRRRLHGAVPAGGGLSGCADPAPAAAACSPAIRPGRHADADLHDCLPAFVTEALEQALPLLEEKLPGYCRRRRPADGGGEPLLLPGADPAG